ncbi:MAG: DUF6308 family protein [Acidimicrobiales bacterium]
MVPYLIEHAGTVTNYDFLAGESDRVTPALVRATRRPWMNSRISADEEAWFIEQGRSAPWHLVPPDAQLRDADPTTVGALYGNASELWEHFRAAAPKRVGVAKISKVLYLMRPGFLPILDSRLTRMYDAAAKVAARDVAKARPDLPKYSRLSWEAVRRDLLVNDAALMELRKALRDVPVALATEAADRLSDARLMDMLAWSAAGEPEDEDQDGQD